MDLKSGAHAEIAEEWEAHAEIAKEPEAHESNTRQKLDNSLSGEN